MESRQQVAVRLINLFDELRARPFRFSSLFVFVRALL